MTEFVGGAAHAAADHLVGILRTRVQTFLQIGGRGRQDEHPDDIDARLLVQLLGALPVDVEQNILSGRQCRFDRRARRTVEIVEYSRPLEQFALLDHPLELRLVDEEIIASFDLPRSHRARRR